MDIWADIVPAFNKIKELITMRNLSEGDLQELIQEEVKKANDSLAFYKQISGYILRYEELERTSTKKIKRHGRKFEDGN